MPTYLQSLPPPRRVCRSYNTAVLTHALLLTGTGCLRVLSLLLALSLLASTPCLATSDALGDVVSALTGAPLSPLSRFLFASRPPAQLACVHAAWYSHQYQHISPHSTPATRLYVPVCSAAQELRLCRDNRRLPAWQTLCLQAV